MAHFLDESLFPAIRQVAAEKRKQEAEENGEELPEEYVHKAPEEDDVNRDNRVTFMFRGDRIPRFRDDLTYEWVPYDAVKLQEHVEFSRHHGAIMLSVYHDGVDSLMQFDEGDRLMGADIVFYVKYIQELPYVSLPEDDPSVLDPKPEDGNETEEPEDLKKHSDPDLSQPVKFAIVGRPNVGKSTLVNRILGESRVIVYDQPGTTRDSIYIPMERGGRQYVIIDTAGVRKRKKVTEVVEKFSVIKTLRAIDDCNVAVLVIDARESVSEQDLGLLSYIISAGRSLVICVNKWDGLSQDQKEKIKIDLQLKLGFVDFADVHFISALHGTGVGNIFDSINEAYRSAVTKISTSMLTRLIIQAQNEHQPPLVSGRRVKLKYAHAGGYNPPKIIIHGNMVDKLPGFYKHYLINYIRKALDIRGTPLDISFLEGENPYENRSDRKTRSEKRAQQRRDKERGRGKPDRKDGQPGKPRASSGRPGQGRGRK
nr:ribosome biogenesis GTPase Der [Succinivibrionaceae bacterium]